MPFIGNKPSAVPLTSADIADSIITSAKIVDGTIVSGDINASAAIPLSKLSTTGTADATTFLRGDGAYTAVSSDFVLLATTDASSSASVSFDGYYSSTYKNYQIIMSGVVPSAANALFYCRFRRSNADVTTSNYTAINNIAYQNAGGSSSPTSGAWNVAYGGINLIDYTSASATYGGINSTISIFAPLNTSGYKHINCQLSFWEPSVAYFYVVQSAVSLLDATTALSGITFYFSTGNITSGNFKLYGIK